MSPAGAFALSCFGSAAQHVADVPQITQPGRIENGAALTLGKLPVHAQLWSLSAPDTSALIDVGSPVAGDGAVFFGNRYGNDASLRGSHRLPYDARLCVRNGWIALVLRARRDDGRRSVPRTAHVGTISF